MVQSFTRRTAANTIKISSDRHWADALCYLVCIPDRGKEFSAYSFQDRIMEYGIKFRAIKPGTPHLSWKVERTQRIDLDEFHCKVDINHSDLPHLLSQCQFHYNCIRSHSSLNRHASIHVITALSSKTPLWDGVGDMYDPSKESIRDQNYWIDCQLKKWKDVCKSHILIDCADVLLLCSKLKNYYCCYYWVVMWETGAGSALKVLHISIRTLLGFYNPALYVVSHIIHPS